MCVSGEIKGKRFGKEQGTRKGIKSLRKKMEEYGHKTHLLNPSLFIKNLELRSTAVLLYVDDWLIVKDDLTEINCLISKLSEAFVITDMGQPREFLGVKN